MLLCMPLLFPSWHRQRRRRPSSSSSSSSAAAATLALVPTTIIPVVAVVPLLLLSFLQQCQAGRSVSSSRNAPPELLPLDGPQVPIRIPVGTRQFKLSCPVRGGVYADHGSEEEGKEEEEEEEEEGEGDDDDDTAEMTNDHHQQQTEELIIKWTKDGQPVQSANAKKGEEEERYRLTNGNRDLRIRWAQPMDGGLYRCTAINEWGHRSVEFRLEVVMPAQQPKSGGGGIGIVLATASSVDDDDLAAGNAAWMLAASHPASAASSSSFVPRIEQPAQTQMLGAGNTAQLLCRVEWHANANAGNAGPVIRWLRQIDNVEAVRATTPNATVLRLGQHWLLLLDQPGNDSAHVQMTTTADGQRRHYVNELRIQNARKEDSGRYFCVATNPNGQFLYHSTLLHVQTTGNNNDGGSRFLFGGLPVPNSPTARLALVLAFGLLLGCPPFLCWFLCFRSRCCCCCRHSSSPSSSCSTACAMKIGNGTKVQGNNSNNNNHYLANNTFTSVISSGGGTIQNSNNKAPASSAPAFASPQSPHSAANAVQCALFPPPPRLPPPMLPPSASASALMMAAAAATGSSGANNYLYGCRPILYQHQQHATKLERKRDQRQQQQQWWSGGAQHQQHQQSQLVPLAGHNHQTIVPWQHCRGGAAAEDEQSRISSHIYASGSPLPPPRPIANSRHQHQLLLSNGNPRTIAASATAANALPIWTSGVPPPNNNMHQQIGEQQQRPSRPTATRQQQFRLPPPPRVDCPNDSRDWHRDRPEWGQQKVPLIEAVEQQRAVAMMGAQK